MVLVPGTDFLTTILNVVAQSLLVPVMILLVIFIIIVLFEIGGLISEYSSRSKLSDEELDDLINNISKSTTKEEIIDYLNSSNLSKKYSDILIKITNTSNFKENTKEAYSRKLIENEEFRMGKSLRRTDIVSKVSSGCGLLGTLIPLGPGLASLGTGDVATLSNQLIIAFNTTTIGLSSSLVAYFISKIRRSWYSEDISTVYVLAEAISEVEL